ncbi:MAG: chemotaxis protein CheW [Gammaproteobacteria bacterium]|nr:chemotaxis protein CheW [Gammaproteobacteria bacterium]MCP5424259.1 chemotaxis protein CheW [Gammaproteobacteria bacterium]MCP5458867.1 chemotaxis protein CheW [Gammaproteobacteria bacterium]
MAESGAWIMDLDSQLQAAVGDREMLHVIQAPELFSVPLSPPYCRHVLIWQDHILPLMDLAAWLNGQSERREHKVAGILAFQPRRDQEVRYGALSLAATPIRAQVDDQQACDLPAHPSGWKRLALSCFQQGNRIIPILDLPTLFSDALTKASRVRS